MPDRSNGHGPPLRPDEAESLEIAHVIRPPPPVQPDSGWLVASKQRLLARFEALNQQPSP
jgi:hypothetical protein